MAEFVALGVGSNQGDRRASIAFAFRGLLPHISDLKRGPIMESTPLDDSEQELYLNTVFVGHTQRSPEEILAIAKALERIAGRRPGPRWGSRPLDLDLLLFGNRLSDRPELRLPHPELRKREFVLRPLAALVPDLSLPPDGLTVVEVLQSLPP